MNTQFETLAKIIRAAVRSEFQTLVDYEIKKLRSVMEEEFNLENEKLVKKIYDKFMDQLNIKKA